MDFDAINAQIDPLDQAAMKRAVDHWNVTFKPIGGLGVLEDIIVQIAGITGDERVCLDKRIGIPMCADNGVVEEGVTQTDQAMTAIVTANMGKGLSSVCVMGRIANMDVRPVDVGIAGDEPLEGVLDRKIMRGTNNMARGPACTREQVEQAIQVGIDMVGQVKAEGYKIVVSGEMGIGNTTTCSAVASVLLGMDPETVTGRGAGLSSAGLERKVNAIKQAIDQGSLVFHASQRRIHLVVAVVAIDVFFVKEQVVRRGFSSNVDPVFLSQADQLNAFLG